MNDNIVTVTIPERLYHRLRSLAKETNREITEVLIASAEAALAVDHSDVTLPFELADELTAMRQFSDQALWAATEPTLSPQQQDRLSALTQKQGSQMLAPVEKNELNELLAEYDRSVLRRAQAFALLSLRGHTMPDLNEPHHT